MHEKITGVIFFTCTFFAAWSQSFDQNDFVKTVKVLDAEGRPFVNPAIGVEGTQFFFKDWKAGSIKLISNLVYNNVSVRLNLQTQEVHYLNPGRIEMSVSPELIKELFIYDTTNGDVTTYDFQCGFPALDKQTTKDFYLVMSNGKVKLLKSIRKEIREDKDLLSGEVKKEFVADEYYYLYSNNSLQLVKLNKTSVLQAMPDKKNEIEEFVKTNKLSYKSANDLRKIADHYNTL